MARHRTAQDYAVYPPPPQPLYKDIDWMGAAKVGAIASAPVVGGLALYGRGLAEQEVPKGHLIHTLRGELRNKSYGAITSTMMQGLKSYGRGSKEGAKTGWSSLKNALKGIGGGALQETKTKYVRKLMSRYDRLVQMNARLEGEIQFAGGYINTEEGVKKERGAGAHFNRAAGRYIGGALLPPLGIAPGYLIDRSRGKHNILKTAGEPKQPGYLAKKEHGRAISPAGVRTAVRLSMSDQSKAILFDENKNPYILPAVGTAAVVGTGATGYGLYRKGLGMPGRTPSERTKIVTNRKGVERDPGYFTRTRELAPSKRGIFGNIVVGGQQVGHEAALAPRILSHPMAREALAHDIRSSVSSRLSRLATRIHP